MSNFAISTANLKQRIYHDSFIDLYNALILMAPRRIRVFNHVKLGLHLLLMLLIAIPTYKVNFNSKPIQLQHTLAKARADFITSLSLERRSCTLERSSLFVTPGVKNSREIGIRYIH